MPVIEYGMTLNITTMSGIENLTKEEMQMCMQCHIPPKQYLHAKNGASLACSL